MKFFYIFFAAATLLCGYFWLTDAPGSGMVWPTLGFAALGGGTAVYDLVRSRKTKAEQLRYTTESEAAQGLQVTKYPGKWNVARSRVLTRYYVNDPRYWPAVRTMYQELGGE